jgi:hypothetical protein
MFSELNRMSAGFFAPPVMTVQLIYFRSFSCRAFLYEVRIRLRLDDFRQNR